MKLISFKKKNEDTRVEDFYKEWVLEDPLEAVTLTRVRNLLEVAVGWKSEATFADQKENLIQALKNELILAWGFGAQADVDLDAELIIGTHPDGLTREIRVDGIFEVKKGG